MFLGMKNRRVNATFQKLDDKYGHNKTSNFLMDNFKLTLEIVQLVCISYVVYLIYAHPYCQLFFRLFLYYPQILVDLYLDL